MKYKINTEVEFKANSLDNGKIVGFEEDTDMYTLGDKDAEEPVLLGDQTVERNRTKIERLLAFLCTIRRSITCWSG